MRLSLTRKIFVLFLPLTVISLLFGVIVYYGLDGIQQANSRIYQFKNFQFQIKELKSWQMGIILPHTDTSQYENFKREINKIRVTAAELAQIHDNLPHNLRLRLQKIPFHMDNFKRSYLKLYNFYDTDHKFPNQNKVLFNKINLRGNNLLAAGAIDPPPLHSFHELLQQLITLQIDIYHNRNISKFPELKEIKGEIGRLMMDDPELLSLTGQFIANIEANYINYLGIKASKDFLKTTYNHFYQISSDTIKAFESKSQMTKRIFVWLIITITFLAILLNLLCWLSVYRYFRRFLINQQHIIQSIEKSDYDFELPLLPDDEIGDLTRILHKLAQSLKENLKKLSDSEERLRNILDAIPDAIFQVDQQMNIIWANKKAGAIGRVVTGEPCCTAFWDREKVCEDSKKSIETAIVHDPGAEDELPRYFEIITVPIHDTLGLINGFVEIVRNVTESMLAEQDKTRLTEQLQQSQKMESIGRLAGGVAHDFNNILSVINGYAEICLLKMEKDHPLREEIQIILESGKRAARLTQQLLAFSRKQIIRQELLDVNREIDNIRKMLDRLLGEDIEIEVFKNKELWPVKIDRSQLEQVILNLSINARDAMPTGGKLTIETTNVSLGEAYMKNHYNITPGDYVMLAISDNGQGMDNETKKHIFEPFFTTKEQGKGTGLGLATVYGIIKQNNGEIQVYSEPGQGTTFKIYMPRSEEINETKEDASRQEDKKLSRGTETIMLVEDDEMVRKMSIDILTELGYTVLEAKNGEDALQICDRYHGTIDLLLTDVVMPKVNGVELAAKMADLCPKTKVLFMSGYTENAIVKHGVLAEDVNFIHKPVTPQSLSQAVRKVLA